MQYLFLATFYWTAEQKEYAAKAYKNYNIVALLKPVVYRAWTLLIHFLVRR